jgi:ATP-dependent RNA helicase SUPV3L1/SUV3
MARAVLENRTTIKAVLGPTNTGKTHRAIERMLEHDTGMIGLPLRLLAREVYDKVSQRVGEGAVALVTGEEKRVPPLPRYWVCTVEAMPLGREVDFVAIDEIQLAGHPERGHVFTARMLETRGRRETWFMGADTIAPILSRLVPTAALEMHPRLSQLRGIGRLTLSGLPPRSAVVAFSAPRVYELAERIRKRRGGAAIVLGALSPRARNAQVALYQSGEVDYMVATDAIGMGLNMDVGCVAFADLRKFDGREARELTEAELAQIAGRAGRYHTDGTFATLAPLGPLPTPVIRAVETHRFPVQQKIWWRSTDLDFSSVAALLESLRKRPTARCLVLVDRAVDSAALSALFDKPEIRVRATGREAVALLWRVCSIPDYRQLLLDEHSGLLSEVYLQLSSGRGRLDADWMRQRIERLNDAQGDLDTLLARMAFIRTWTYITQHAGWVADAETWQARTRAIEDRLSDALHDLLVRRFVDRGKGAKRRQARPVKPAVGVTPKRGLAELIQLRFGVAGQVAETPSADAWARELAEAEDERFRTDDAGRIWDGDSEVAALAPGIDLVRPEIAMAPSTRAMGAGARHQLLRRLNAYARDLVAETLGPLRDADRTALSPAARGLVYQLEKALGTVRANNAREQIDGLLESDRTILQQRGVTIGRKVVYVERSLKGPLALRRVALASVFFGAKCRIGPPSLGMVSFRPQAGVPEVLYDAVGYPVFGARAVRADMVERIAALLPGSDPDVRVVSAWLGCRVADAARIARELAGDTAPRTVGEGVQ